MRRAVVRTDHGDAATARTVASAVRPDNTAEMDTQVDGTTVTTSIERETTGGLHSTVDDYVVNLHVAAQLAHHPTDAPARPRTDGDAGDGASTHNNTDT